MFLVQYEMTTFFPLALVFLVWHTPLPLHVRCLVWQFLSVALPVASKLLVGRFIFGTYSCFRAAFTTTQIFTVFGLFQPFLVTVVSGQRLDFSELFETHWLLYREECVEPGAKVLLRYLVLWELWLHELVFHCVLHLI